MFENEEQTEIIGARCTLHEAYKGYTEGAILGSESLSSLTTVRRLLNTVMK